MTRRLTTRSTGWDTKRRLSERGRVDELATEVGEPGRNPKTGIYKLTESIVPRKISQQPTERGRR